MIPWPTWVAERFNPTPRSGEARAAYWEDSAAHWRALAVTAEDRVAELEPLLRAVLDAPTGSSDQARAERLRVRVDALRALKAGDG